MPKKPNPEVHPAPPVLIQAVCPDKHEAQFKVATVFAVVGANTYEVCLKPSTMFPSQPCGKPLKVKRIF